MGANAWLIGLASAFGIKLSSSIDDVVWLAPFLTANSSAAIRFQNCIIYGTVCMTQTMVAMVIAFSGKAAVKALTGGAKNAWSTEKILTVGAGIMLSLYSIKLSHEYYQECMNPEEEGGGEENNNPEAGQYAKVATGEGGDIEMAKPMSARDMVPGMAIDNPNAAQDAIDKADRERQQTLFVVAFIGSIDDLTLFVPMLVGKGFDFVQLMGGAFAATVLILTFCICIGLCKPIADCLAKIPLAAIVIVFAVVLLLKGFVFDEEDKKDVAKVATTAMTNITTSLMPTSTSMMPATTTLLKLLPTKS